MTEKEALGLAAAAWCGEKTKNTVMDVELAKEFAKILRREVEKAYQGRKGILGNPFYEVSIS